MRSTCTAALIAAAGLAATGALTACGSGDTADASDGISIVASTNVWAGIAQEIGGDAVSVQALISDPAADPHSYESAPRDVASVADADLVVVNGGGYDGFLESILDSLDAAPAVVNAYSIHLDEHDEGAAHDESHDEGAAHDEGGDAAHAGHDHGSQNEHVWYDFDTVAEVAHRIAEQLAAIDPEQAAEFEANAEQFGGEVDGLEAQAAELRGRYQGAAVAQTEPLAGYLIDIAGLEDIAPAEFARAIEEETDPSAAATAQFSDLLERRDAQALLFNAQTASAATDQLRAIAERQQVPVVSLTETMPADTDYIAWMTTVLGNLDAALGRS